MADQESQNQADAEAVVTEPQTVETGEGEAQNAPGDQSNNQGAGEQAEEVATNNDQEVAESEPTEKKESTQENEQAQEKEATQEDPAENPAGGENDQAQEKEATQEDSTENAAGGESEQAQEKEATQEDPTEKPAGGEDEQAQEKEATQEDPTDKPADGENEQEATSQKKEENADEGKDEDKQEVAADETAGGDTNQNANADESESPKVQEPTEEEENQQPAEDNAAVEEEEPTAAEPEAGEETTEPIVESPPDSTEDAPALEEEPVAADSTEDVVPEIEETPEETVGEQQEEPQEQQPEEQEGPSEAEPVQVETSVNEGPPGSPKIAMEEKKSTGVNLDATATVKFVLMPSGQVVTLACTLGQTLESLKSHFSMELKMSAGLIMIMFDGKNMPDSTTLADLGVGPNGTVQLEMQSADPVNTPLKPYRPRQEYHMPDVITVRVMTEDGESRDVVVEIERSRFKKPFLGGFRNKHSGIEFHNAAAQTAKKPRPPPTVERFCRDTQTCEQKNIRQQTTNTTSTQMTGIGVYVSNTEDKLLTPGKYFSADEHCDMILRHVIILQKYYRRWLAKRYVTKLKEDKAKRLEWERQEELRKKREKEERIKRDYARRLNPKTKADFDMLLNCLEKWRQEEMERINATLTGAERKAALCMLLDQETELLSAIERHKNEANKDNTDNRIMAFLEKAAAPKKWQGHDGKLTYMDTPFTIRAKELRDIYNSINMKYLTQDERLDVLLTLKHTVKEHDCKLTQEIIELIDREADLLMRGVKEGNLTGLRKRISTLFLQYIKTPTFNPEAARLLKVPQDPSTLRKNINYCHSCGRYLPSTEFFITSNSKQVGRCRNCMKVENDGRQREDYTFYRVMLKALRKSEESMQDGSSICYLLQENDLRYLVENIWSNQSVLSAWDDLYDLVLVRWDKHQEWSPWNCILLTHDEAEAHQKLFSLEEGYGQVFIHKVTQKHNFARNYFSRLPGMAELLRQKVGNRDLINNANGPAVSGHTVAKAQKV